MNENGLPPHIEESLQAIAELHAKQSADATRFQRIVAIITESLGRPRFLVVLALAVLVWIGVSLFSGLHGGRGFDPPPFIWLQFSISLVVLFMTVFILSAQQRDDIKSGHRERLALELAILSDQKSAKIISLLEDLRRDSPAVPNRVDEQADAMSTPANPSAVLEAIKESASGSEPSG